jgi:hypothetical protein
MKKKVVGAVVGAVGVGLGAEIVHEGEIAKEQLETFARRHSVPIYISPWWARPSHGGEPEQPGGPLQSRQVVYVSTATVASAPVVVKIR